MHRTWPSQLPMGPGLGSLPGAADLRVGRRPLVIWPRAWTQAWVPSLLTHNLLVISDTTLPCPPPHHHPTPPLAASMNLSAAGLASAWGEGRAQDGSPQEGRELIFAGGQARIHPLRGQVLLYPHHTDEETGSEEGSHFPKATQPTRAELEFESSSTGSAAISLQGLRPRLCAS